MSVTCFASKPPYLDHFDFYGENLYVPKGTKNLYQTADG